MRKRYLLVFGLIAALTIPTVAAADGRHRGDRDRDRDNVLEQELRDVDFFHVDLDAVPHRRGADGGSNVSGDALLIRSQTKLTVVLSLRGLSPNLVHAQHIHGIGMSQCPNGRDDDNRDGLITTTEGHHDYGQVVTSLTTTGDATPASGLAVDRFPIASGGGTYVYQRTFDIGTDVPVDVANQLHRYQLVVHGIDVNRNGTYDMAGAGPSDLDPSLPQEATVPAACGEIEH
jgi:hypothetical protein